MDQPLVSVISLTYKNFNFIIDAIDSILIQDYENIEYVLADDGSLNFSVYKNKIEKYLQENKKGNIKNIILYHSEENVGTVKNYNKAVELSNGKYLITISDDLFNLPNSLSKVVKYAEEHNSLIVSTPVIYFNDKESRVVPGKWRFKILQRMTISQLYTMLQYACYLPAVGILYNKELFHRYGVFDETFKYVEDYPYWLHLLKNNVKIDFMNLSIVKYRTSGLSSTLTVSEYHNAVIEENKRIFLEIIDNLKSLENGLNYKDKFILYSAKKTIQGLEKASWSRTPFVTIIIWIYFYFCSINRRKE